MGAKVIDHNYEPNSTPKLSLSKLPCKPPRVPIQIMLTPPLHPSVSIPFRWEEAPGKPRPQPPPSTAAPSPPVPPKTKVARCLDLPPAAGLLQDDAKITIMPSPATVLDGPYVGRSLSLACTFSFRKGPRDDGRFGSARWGSFREEEKPCRGNLDISHTLGEFFRSENNVKMASVRRRRRSFFNLAATMNSNLQDIYASFKRAVPWRRS